MSFCIFSYTMKKLGGDSLRSGERWLVACILIVVVLVVARLEESGIIKSDVRTVVSSSEDLVLLQNMVRQVVDGEKETVIVSGALQTQELLLFTSAQPLADGFLLTYDEPPFLKALQDGFIVYTGHTKQTGKTMTVHYGEVAVTYGQLDSFNHLPYTSIVRDEVLAIKSDDSPLFLKMEVKGDVLSLDQMLYWLKEWDGQ